MTQDRHASSAIKNAIPVLDTAIGLDYQFGMEKTATTAEREKHWVHLVSHRKAAGLADHELAERMQTSQAQVNRLENGKRKLTVEWANRYAAALGKTREQVLRPLSDNVNDGYQNGNAQVERTKNTTVVSPPNAGLANEPVEKTRRFIDVLGRAAGGREGKFILNGDRIDRILCPPSVEAASKPYAVYVFGTSMSPRYDDGEMVVANPDAPYRQGNYVVVQLTTDEENVFECYVKKFVSFGSKELVLEQLNPPKGHEATMRFPAKRVHAIHKLVGPDGK